MIELVGDVQNFVQKKWSKGEMRKEEGQDDDIGRVDRMWETRREKGWGGGRERRGGRSSNKGR